MKTSRTVLIALIVGLAVGSSAMYGWLAPQIGTSGTDQGSQLDDVLLQEAARNLRTSGSWMADPIPNFINRSELVDLLDSPISQLDIFVSLLGSPGDVVDAETAEALESSRGSLQLVQRSLKAETSSVSDHESKIRTIGKGFLELADAFEAGDRSPTESSNLVMSSNRVFMQMENHFRNSTTIDDARIELSSTPPVATVEFSHKAPSLESRRYWLIQVCMSSNDTTPCVQPWVNPALGSGELTNVTRIDDKTVRLELPTDWSDGTRFTVRTLSRFVNGEQVEYTDECMTRPGEPCVPVET